MPDPLQTHFRSVNHRGRRTWSIFRGPNSAGVMARLSVLPRYMEPPMKGGCDSTRFNSILICVAPDHNIHRLKALHTWWRWAAAQDAAINADVEMESSVVHVDPLGVLANAPMCNSTLPPQTPLWFISSSINYLFLLIYHAAIFSILPSCPTPISIPPFLPLTQG